jgi:hypothetical protein
MMGADPRRVFTSAVFLGVFLLGCSDSAGDDPAPTASGGSAASMGGTSTGGGTSGTGGSGQAGSVAGGGSSQGGSSGQGGTNTQGGTDSGGTAGSGQSGGGGTAGSGGSAAGDTWTSYAMAFFGTYCVSCHNDDNSGDASRDYTMMTVVENEADEIACGLTKSQDDWAARGCSGAPAARQFPAGSGAMPDDAERDRLIAWIDAGMPE